MNKVNKNKNFQIVKVWLRTNIKIDGYRLTNLINKF